MQAKIAAISAGDFPGDVRPAVYFGEAPQVTGSGGQVQPTTQGYCVLRHNGTRSRALAFGPPPVTRDDVGLEIEAYYPTLEDALSAVNVIRAALDYGTLPDLDSSLQLKAIRPRSDQPQQAGLGKTGAVVHGAKYGFDLEILRGA